MVLSGGGVQWTTTTQRPGQSSPPEGRTKSSPPEGSPSPNQLQREAAKKERSHRGSKDNQPRCHGGSKDNQPRSHRGSKDDQPCRGQSHGQSHRHGCGAPGGHPPTSSRCWTLRSSWRTPRPLTSAEQRSGLREGQGCRTLRTCWTCFGSHSGFGGGGGQREPGPAGGAGTGLSRRGQGGT